MGSNTPRQRSAALYHEAARRIAEDEPTKEHSCTCSCCMVGEVGGLQRRVDYAEMFRPEGHPPDGSWGVLWDDIDACRVLALCFMAAMVEAGDA